MKPYKKQPPNLDDDSKNPTIKHYLSDTIAIAKWLKTHLRDKCCNTEELFKDLDDIIINCRRALDLMPDICPTHDGLCQCLEEKPENA